MKNLFALISILFVFMVIPISLSQTCPSGCELGNGTESITLQRIILTRIPSRPGLVVQDISVSGDFNYLNVFWNATYIPPGTNRIGVNCYLNCHNFTGDLDLQCSGYKNCSYIGNQGLASCSIQSPNYIFGFVKNNVTCKFFDPDNNINFLLPNEENPDVGKNPAVNFTPLNFTPYVSNISTVVGKRVSWKISVTNLGLLNDNYTVNITDLPNWIIVNPSILNTSTVAYSELTSVYPEVFFINADSANIVILFTSNTDNFVCSQPNDCQGLPNSQCINNKCTVVFSVQVKSQFNSLPDFDLFGLLIIVIVSSSVFSFIIFRKKQ
jgi:hypothetical protein